MNQIVSSQTRLFITSIEIGIMMGIIFDLVRIVRKIIKHPNFFVQLEDMLYWIFCGFTGFYMLYICNYADIRPYIFIGIILGATLYFLTFSIVFMGIMTRIINYVKAVLRKLYHLILIPDRGTIRLIKVPLNYIQNKHNQMKYYQKLKRRAVARKKYQQEADKKTERFLKNQKI